jgi:hypothetical protein
MSPFGGDDKGSEVPALFETGGGGIQVLLLFLALLLGQDLMRVTRTVGFGIRICHLDTIDDGVSPAGLEATDEEISMIFVT